MSLYTYFQILFRSIFPNAFTCWAWWYMTIIPTVGKLRQEDKKFETSLGYMVRPCSKRLKEVLPIYIASFPPHPCPSLQTSGGL
jgi:hypothetical protein